MELQSIFERIRFLRAEMTAIEKRIIEDSLTLEEIKSLDDEWEILDAELEMYDDMLELAQAEDRWEVSQMEEPEEEENPPDWLVAQWEAERDQYTNQNTWVYTSTFDLGDEV